MKIGREEISEALAEQRKCYFTADLPKYGSRVRERSGWEHYARYILASDSGVADIKAAVELRRSNENFLDNVDRAFTELKEAPSWKPPDEVELIKNLAHIANQVTDDHHTRSDSLGGDERSLSKTTKGLKEDLLTGSSHPYAARLGNSTALGESLKGQYNHSYSLKMSHDGLLPPQRYAALRHQPSQKERTKALQSRQGAPVSSGSPEPSISRKVSSQAQGNVKDVSAWERSVGMFDTEPSPTRSSYKLVDNRKSNKRSNKALFDLKITKMIEQRRLNKDNQNKQKKESVPSIRASEVKFKQLLKEQNYQKI